jgi:hypothetical protein
VPGRPSRDLLDARLAAARERRRGALAAAAAAPVVDRPGPSEPSGEPEVVRPRSGADPSLHAARHRRPPAPHTRGRHRSAASARRRLALVVTCLVVCCAAAVVVLAA